MVINVFASFRRLCEPSQNSNEFIFLTDFVPEKQEDKTRTSFHPGLVSLTLRLNMLKHFFISPHLLKIGEFSKVTDDPQRFPNGKSEENICRLKPVVVTYQKWQNVWSGQLHYRLPEKSYNSFPSRWSGQNVNGILLSGDDKDNKYINHIIIFSYREISRLSEMFRTQQLLAELSDPHKQTLTPSCRSSI